MAGSARVVWGVVEHDAPFKVVASGSDDRWWRDSALVAATVLICAGGAWLALLLMVGLGISGYGECSGYAKMKQEIYANGPISCGIDATSKMEDYTGGIYSEENAHSIDHIISVVGWGMSDGTEGLAKGKQYWIVRNSWGEYWGEMGYVRVEKGNNALALETQCAWAVPKAFTTTNTPCYEDGSNCKAK